MLRLALLLSLVACAPEPHGDPGRPGGGPLPDAYLGCVGAFQIAAPKADLHYTASLDVIVDESELQYELALTMIDNVGTSYQYTTDSSMPDPDGTFWNRDKFHYELAAGRRYDLTVGGCSASQPDTQTVTFFTSP